MLHSFSSSIILASIILASILLVCYCILYAVECEVGFYGVNCTKECDCGDRASSCNITNGCVDCNNGWTGDQCLTDINECDKSPCGSTANVCTT